MNKKTILIQIVLVLCPFMFSQIVLALILHYTGFKYFDSSNWLRWDSVHYLQIADKGYEFFPCAGKFGYSSSATEMCGNTGWFPGYPLLIRLFSFFGADTTLLAGVLSKVFYLLTIFMVMNIIGIKEFSLKNFLILSIATFCFGFIYYNAIFPISTMLFFVLSGLYFYIKKQIWFTGLFCFLASVSYPTGFLLSIVFAISILCKKNECLKQKLTTLLIPIIMGFLGIVAVFVFFQITVNDWTAFMQVQAKYRHDFKSPITNMISFFQNASLLAPFSINNFIQYQSFFIIIGYIIISFYFFINRMFKNELYLWAYIYTTLFFIFPWLVAGDLSRYRSESLLLPFVFLLKEVKTKWLAVILICFLGIGMPMSYLFFTSVLV